MLVGPQHEKTNRMLNLVILAISLLVNFAVAAPPSDKIDGCVFCTNGVIQLGPFAVKSFEPPPATSNIFSSIDVDQSEHFVLKVTRGAFVPFYFLIISKDHYTRVADLPPNVMNDLKKFKSHVERFYKEVLQEKFVVFEHGSLACSGGGGCVDHLHLHILPFAGQIENSPDLNLPTRFDPVRKMKDLSDLKAPDLRETPYIFYQNPDEEMHLYRIIDHTPSQLLRLLIAENLKIDDEFNWREFVDKGDFWENSAQSVSGYSTWLATDAATARSKIRQKGWNVRVSGQRKLFEAASCFQWLKSE